MLINTERTAFWIDDDVAEDKALLWANYLEYSENEFDEDVGGYYSEEHITSEFDRGLGLLCTTSEDGEYDLQATIYPDKLELVLEVAGAFKDAKQTHKYSTIDEMREDCFDTSLGTWDEMWDRLMDVAEENGLIDEDGNAIPSEEELAPAEYEISYLYAPNYTGQRKPTERFAGTWKELQDYLDHARPSDCSVDIRDLREEN